MEKSDDMEKYYVSHIDLLQRSMSEHLTTLEELRYENAELEEENAGLCLRLERHERFVSLVRQFIQKKGFDQHDIDEFENELVLDLLTKKENE